MASEADCSQDVRGEKWYGAKTAYRIDVGNDTSVVSSCIETRIVLIRACPNSAIDVALQEARDYAETYLRYDNPDGNPVVGRALDFVELYRMDEDEPLGHKSEVFSDMETVGKDVPDEDVLSSVFGPDRDQNLPIDEVFEPGP